MFGKKKKVEIPQKYPKVDKNNIDAFLKDVSISIDKTFSGNESSTLQKHFQEELTNWIKSTIEQGQELDPATIKLGICLGIKEVLRLINEAEKDKDRPVYVA